MCFFITFDSLFNWNKKFLKKIGVSSIWHGYHYYSIAWDKQTFNGNTCIAEFGLKGWFAFISFYLISYLTLAAQLQQLPLQNSPQSYFVTKYSLVDYLFTLKHHQNSLTYHNKAHIHSKKHWTFTLISLENREICIYFYWYICCIENIDQPCPRFFKTFNEIFISVS